MHVCVSEGERFLESGPASNYFPYFRVLCAHCVSEGERFSSGEHAVISLTSATRLFIFRVCFCLCVCTWSRECHQSSYVYLFIFPIKPKCNMYIVLSTGIVKNMKG